MSIHQRQRTRTDECTYEVEHVGGKARIHLKATSLDDKNLGPVVLAQLEAFLVQQWEKT